MAERVQRRRRMSREGGRRIQRRIIRGKQNARGRDAAIRRDGRSVRVQAKDSVREAVPCEETSEMTAVDENAIQNADARDEVDEVPPPPFSLVCSLDDDDADSAASSSITTPVLHKLHSLLASSSWELADAETRSLLIRFAGSGAVDRGWVYFTEAKQLHSSDLLLLDALWRHHSKDRFGYSVQRRVWMDAGRRWTQLFRKLDWVHGEDDAYRKWPEEFTYNGTEAVRGHLPLTNCLRGTKLFQAILEHEAFNGAS